jgi:hypothetical protein
MFCTTSLGLLNSRSRTDAPFTKTPYRLITRFAITLAGFILLLLPANVSAQGIVNPGFEESPDLKGWTLSPNGDGSAPNSLNGIILPTEGSRFGLITTVGNTDTSQFGGTAGTILTQTFHAFAGSTLSLDYNFLTNEATPSTFNDFGRGQLLDSNGNVIAQLFNADTNSPTSAVFGGPFAEQTGWQTVKTSISVTGTYTLRFIVSDAVDTIVNSALGLDNIILAPPPLLIISEYRLRGPNGANDEFVELINPTHSATTVSTTDGSAGWALVASDGVARFVVPNNTVIPPGGHFLAVNSEGYSLGDYPAGSGATTSGDVLYSQDIPDRAGIALFNTALPSNFTPANRLDAAGYASSPLLFREGDGFPTDGAETFTNLQYSFLRYLGAGTPQDTNNNLADFVGVETSGISTGLGARLGAPGPENSSGPIQRNVEISSTLLDPFQASSTVPNRVRSTQVVTNGALGTLDIRRTITNNSTSNVTRLRFRIVNITSFSSPSGTADLRALTSPDIFVTRSDGSNVLVRGTTLEEPPAQPSGGATNSTLSAGTITLATPLEPSASINVRFLLGVQQSGRFTFFVNIEALP